MSPAGEADHEHWLADARELDGPRRAAQDRLKALSQFPAPVGAREDVYVAAKSDHDVTGPFCPVWELSGEHCFQSLHPPTGTDHDYAAGQLWKRVGGGGTGACIAACRAPGHVAGRQELGERRARCSCWLGRSADGVDAITGCRRCPWLGCCALGGHGGWAARVGDGRPRLALGGSGQMVAGPAVARGSPPWQVGAGGLRGGGAGGQCDRVRCQ
jgi:hypothetical protein